jgi:Rieske Fe-S protein
MERKDFIKTCGLVCMGGTVFAVLLNSCAVSKIISGNIVDSDLVVQASEFETLKDDQKTYKRYVIVQADKLKYPICVYRFSDNNYTALWMSCTHQGTELQVSGDRLHCPAHGSEFSNNGLVQNGPADKPLRVFPVTVNNGLIKIQLR